MANLSQDPRRKGCDLASTTTAEALPDWPPPIAGRAVWRVPWWHRFGIAEGHIEPRLHASQFLAEHAVIYCQDFPLFRFKS